MLDRKIGRWFVLAVLTVTLALSHAPAAEACARPRTPPVSQECSVDASGTIQSAGAGSAVVRFAGADGTALATSREMSFDASGGCLAAIAVPRHQGADVTGVTFPASYPAFTEETDLTRAGNAEAFMERYLELIGRQASDFEVFVFSTAPGVAIPAGVDFDLDVSYSIPTGSDGSELADGQGVIGFLTYSGREVSAESSVGGPEVVLDQYDTVAQAALLRSRTQPPTGSALLATLDPAAQMSAGRPALGSAEPRNFDARVAENAGVERPPAPGQLEALERLRDEVPGLTARFERTTGVTRTLFHPLHPFTAGVGSGSPRDVARAFVAEHHDALGLTSEDLAGMELTDEVPSPISGTTHLYWRQALDGIPVYNGQLHANVDDDGRLLSVHNGFLPGLAAAANTLDAVKGAEQAVAAAARHLELETRGTPAVLSSDDDARRTTVVDPAGISLEPIEAKLAILPVNRGTARLVWSFQIQTLDEQHWYDFTVDAVSGKVWTRFDWVGDATYRVYALPAESPDHASPLPPGDGRTLVVDPEDPTASLFGWHDDLSSTYQITRGNNVHAYHDRDNDNLPPSSEVDGGSSLTFDFPIDLTSQPSAYIDAAVTNLFYWNNVIHDVQYQYGFNEAAGNFQVNNMFRGGVGGDAVLAEAQDGGGSCNGNFASPPDGTAPRMQLYTCSDTFPRRDADLDNGVILHEYGHGISIRQVGGPSNSSCLNNTQTPLEGWADWFALAYTAEVGDAGTDKRGIGNYLFGLPPDGGGVRPQPYSTDPSINNYTYNDIEFLISPHDTGSVWAQTLWEMYWGLVDEHGFDPDLYDVGAFAGNHRAMFYVNEGLKNTACSPDFLDARDAVIQAAQAVNGGQDVCTLWESFANIGLGVDAASAGPNSTNVANGFSLPVGSCPTGAVYLEDFDDGVAQAFSQSGGSTDLWRLDSQCVTPPSGPWSLSFSRPSPDCDYDVGLAQGTVTLPVLDLSGLCSATLSFDHFWETENSFFSVFDRLIVETSTDGGASWSVLGEINSLSGNPSGFIHEELSIPTSSQFRLRFRFDSVDGVSNDFLGWYIDNIAINAE